MNANPDNDNNLNANANLNLNLNLNLNANQLRVVRAIKIVALVNVCRTLAGTAIEGFVSWPVPWTTAPACSPSPLESSPPAARTCFFESSQRST